MKHLYVILAVLFLSSHTLFAQDKDLKDLYTDFTTAINSALLTKKGSVELSGFLSYNSVKTVYQENQQTTESITQLEPQLSYIFIDNLSAGLIFSYTHIKSEYKNWILPAIYTFPEPAEQTMAGPILKMYFTEEKLRPFVFADYLLMFGDSDGGEMDLGAGVFYHVSGNFGLNLFAKYGILWPDEKTIDSQQRIFIGLGISNFIL